MKTSIRLTLCLALAALPLPAQGLPAPAPPDVAEAGNEHSPEAIQAARDIIAFIGEMNTIAASDKPEAEKIAAIRALKPRAAELAELRCRIGMPKIKRAAQSLYSQEQMESHTAALDEAQSDEELAAALDEIGNTFQGMLDPATPPADVASAFLAAMRESAALLNDKSLPWAELADRLAMQAERMHSFYPWLEQGGDSKAVADILIAGGEIPALIEAHEAFAQSNMPEDNKQLALAGFFYMSTLGEVLGELYSRHLPQPPSRGGDSGTMMDEEEEYDEEYAPDEPIIQQRPSDKLAEPTAEAKAAAKHWADLTRQCHGILTSGQTTEEKRAALQALKPEAARLGDALKNLPMSELVRALAPMEKALDDATALIDETTARSPELGPVLEELGCLMRGEPDPSHPAPAADMADEFLTILGCYTATMEDSSLSDTEQKDALIKLNNRLYHCGLWAQRSSELAELRQRLQQEGKLDKALKAVQAIAAERPRRKGGETNFQRSMFGRILDDVLSSFGLAGEQEAPAAEDENIFPED